MIGCSEEGRLVWHGDPVECRPSKAKLLGLIVLAGALLGACYFCTTRPGLMKQAVGWFGLVFFGMALVAIIVQLFRDGPQIVIGEEGIEDRRMKIGVIRWADIRSVSIRSLKSNKFLCVEVVDPAPYLARLPRWKRALAGANRALGFSALTIGFTGLSPGANEVWALIRERLDA